MPKCAREYALYKQEYTLLPTQLVFKVDQLTEYERDELLKKWKLDKLSQQRRDSIVEPGDLLSPNSLVDGVNEEVKTESLVPDSS